MMPYEWISRYLKNCALVALGSFALSHTAPLFLEMKNHYFKEEYHIHPEIRITNPYYFSIRLSGVTTSGSYTI